jgi:uncharacterized OB-fold protein
MSSDFYLADGLMIPDETTAGPSAPFWHSLRNHELVVQQCQACGTTQNPAEYLCYSCHSSQFKWIGLPPAGRIFSWTRVWHPVHELLTDRVPYLLVWVEIDHRDRPRFLGNLLGDPMQDVRMGTPVEGVFEDHADGTLLQWERVRDETTG